MVSLYCYSFLPSIVGRFGAFDVLHDDDFRYDCLSVPGLLHIRLPIDHWLLGFTCEQPSEITTMYSVTTVVVVV